ncbi:Rieske 2Fe-2S domain-containing protein [uncultured Thiohalocapsa sp.]|uniref:aromatic ring-hydroxylating dioxygenase subunit alpha n=1 Tax=uncultured Thiohalocapsa sp. TaxID=768990 RepID=UPI0026000398|nr:Rieske 2Fe-2S domain-containing protein [uncultured Thiohalocapsa sp.]
MSLERLATTADPHGSAAPSADPEPAAKRFDWRQHWYPVAFVRDLLRDRPHAFSLYDEPLVLFFDGAGRLGCLRDQCAHRAARLSDGCLRDGRLECLYHGWQYDVDGACRHIPQLSAGRSIPPKAAVTSHPVVAAQGIAWVWPGDPAAADEALLPLVDELDADGVTRVDFQMDLPYDQSWFIENVIDIAHIHIAHDGMRGGGHRHLAGPLQFDVLQNDARGIIARFRSDPGSDAGRAPSAPDQGPLEDARMEFHAPNLVRYRSVYRDRSRIAGLALYSIPLGRSRCRMLYRKFSNFTSRAERRKPRWLEHWTQCTILEQDMGVVVGQHATVEGADQPLKDLWLPIRSSDPLVLAYRRWLDRHGASLPFYRGLDTAKDPTPPPDPAAGGEDPVDRYRLHTRICATCSRMHRRLTTLGRMLPYTGAGLLVAALLLPGQAVTATLAGLGGLAFAGGAGADWMRRRFE